jgi:glycerophosphoryl diester phosphodiesterase
MKKKFIGFICLIGFVLIITFFMIAPSIKSIGGDEYIIGAHRGNSQDYIENTLSALKSAAEEPKYAFIEFDVQYTKDKVLIVFHDKSLLRLQKKSQKIEDLTYAELLNITSYKIPTYQEVMDEIAHKKPLNIEIKSRGNQEDDENIADDIISDLQNRGIIKSTLISSGSKDLLIYINRFYNNPNYKNNFIQENKFYPGYLNIDTGLVYWVTTSTFVDFDTFTSRVFSELEKTQADYLMLHGSNLRNYESLKKLKSENVTLVFWYFNDEMYLIEPKAKQWVFKLKPPIISKGFSKEMSNDMSQSKICKLWWC